MITYLFSNAGNLLRTGMHSRDILNILQTVANKTDTRDLVVSLYLLRGRHENRGTAYVKGWMTPTHFTTTRGKWSITSQWAIPPDLPPKFKLIRMRLDGNKSLFPRTEKDRYGWEFRYATFQDHLATLFAHELHHYRRFHLGFHPREGEYSANLWALRLVRDLGFCVEGKKLRKKRRKQSSRTYLLRKFPQHDPFSNFRQLRSGAQLIVMHDPHGKYLGQNVTVVRPIRSNSIRIVVQTSDGKIWRWPMKWLELTSK